jgi:hypothetical protein
VSKTLNTNSEKYIAQRINRELDQIILEMYSQEEVTASNGAEEGEEEQKEAPSQKHIIKAKKLNYLRLKEFLIHLGMINEPQASSDSAERVMLYDLWKVLRGEQKGEVSFEDVKALIFCILRITHHKRIGVEEDHKVEGDEQEVGFYN